MRLRADGVRPNCSQNFSMILRFVWAMATCVPAAGSVRRPHHIPMLGDELFRSFPSGICLAVPGKGHHIQVGQHPHLSKDFPQPLPFFLASSSSQSGQRGSRPFSMGSFLLRGRWPGLPSSTLSAVGFGFLPRTANGAHLPIKKPLRAVRQRGPHLRSPRVLFFNSS